MDNQPIAVTEHERQVQQFKPEHGIAATNSNDLRLFLYEWFTRFEHAAPSAFYLGHLDDADMHIAFPGATPLTSHADFVQWYDNLLAQTVWNFHDVSALQIKQTTLQTFAISFIVDWYGEVKADSEQLAGWQSRNDSNLYHYKLRQTWTVKTADRFIIETLVVTDGNTPSPIDS